MHIYAPQTKEIRAVLTVVEDERCSRVDRDSASIGRRVWFLPSVKLESIKLGFSATAAVSLRVP